MAKIAASMLRPSGQTARSHRRRGDPYLVVAMEGGRPLASGARYHLAGVERIVVGRGERRCGWRQRRSDLRVEIPDRWMSKVHAHVLATRGRWSIQDAQSKNGTRVNGRATNRAVLRDGDVIELGHTILLLYSGDSAAPTRPLEDLDAEKRGDELPGFLTLVPSLGEDLDKLRRVAPSELPVLLEGESGTGKELLARGTHEISGRTGPFVAVNCGAIPPHITESQLFALCRGALPGATDFGLPRASAGGTLFLEEIGDLSLGSQAALLQVLQEVEARRHGAGKPTALGFRLVAATHRNLDQLVAKRAFRADLLAYLSSYRMQLPRLADRREDLGLLVAAMLRPLIDEGHPGFTADALRALFAYAWPLNLRELEQTLRAAVALCGPSAIASQLFPAAVRNSARV